MSRARRPPGMAQLIEPHQLSELKTFRTSRCLILVTLDWGIGESLFVASERWTWCRGWEIPSLLLEKILPNNTTKFTFEWGTLTVSVMRCSEFVTNSLNTNQELECSRGSVLSSLRRMSCMLGWCVNRLIKSNWLLNQQLAYSFHHFLHLFSPSFFLHVIMLRQHTSSPPLRSLTTSDVSSPKTPDDRPPRMSRARRPLPPRVWVEACSTWYIKTIQDQDVEQDSDDLQDRSFFRPSAETPCENLWWLRLSRNCSCLYISHEVWSNGSSAQVCPSVEIWPSSSLYLLSNWFPAIVWQWPSSYRKEVLSWVIAHQ